MKILCSGNPYHNTIASGIRKIYPHASFASRKTGYDLRFWDPGSEDYFRNAIINYNVFINSSYLCKWGQHQLLEVTHEEWSENKIQGHIINIGSSAEFLGIDSSLGSYTVQKLALRDLSLQLHKKNNIKTTHIIVGGINDGKPGHEDWLKIDNIAKTIKYAVDHPDTIPLISIL